MSFGTNLCIRPLKHWFVSIYEGFVSLHCKLGEQHASFNETEKDTCSITLGLLLPLLGRPGMFPQAGERALDWEKANG